MCSSRISRSAAPVGSFSSVLLGSLQSGSSRVFPVGLVSGLVSVCVRLGLPPFCVRRSFCRVRPFRFVVWVHVRHARFQSTRRRGVRSSSVRLHALFCGDSCGGWMVGWLRGRSARRSVAQCGRSSFRSAACLGPVPTALNLSLVPGGGPHSGSTPDRGHYEIQYEDRSSRRSHVTTHKESACV